FIMAAQIISKDQPTLPKMFKTQGYNTGIVGKWHLGLGDGKLDFNKSISGTPNDVGFDQSFIMAAQIISKDQPTLPKMFKTQGYNTGIVGKWHLGLGDGK
ncbi:sulfatase-like hydrolase/transferase, partial [Staphylococcus aureus]|uniref:sulfatase-like hydrolase/transferase n=1 Tax=Staphylococcus aureus TaxID=1280 RepID=UPI00301CA2EA